jgi:hypothetical protein
MKLLALAIPLLATAVSAQSPQAIVLDPVVTQAYKEIIRTGDVDKLIALHDTVTEAYLTDWADPNCKDYVLWFNLHGLSTTENRLFRVVCTSDYKRKKGWEFGFVLDPTDTQITPADPGWDYTVGHMLHGVGITDIPTYKYGPPEDSTDTQEMAMDAEMSNVELAETLRQFTTADPVPVMLEYIAHALARLLEAQEHSKTGGQ